jgi:hypothetical protein
MADGVSIDIPGDETGKEVVRLGYPDAVQPAAKAFGEAARPAGKELGEVVETAAMVFNRVVRPLRILV